MAVFFHRHTAGQPFGIGRRRIGDGRLVEHLRAIELVDGVADHQFGNGLAIFGGRLLQLLDGLDDDGVAHGRSPQTRGSVLKTSRSVVRSVNLSESLLPRSCASVAGAPASRRATGRGWPNRNTSRPRTPSNCPVMPLPAGEQSAVTRLATWCAPILSARSL